MSAFVGIDTSNYTTSASLCEDGKIIANLKRPVFVPEGMRGARQSDALFSHIKNMPDLMAELKEYTAGKSIAAIGVSEKPRDIEGSYMPCFLAGISSACSMAALAGCSVYRFSHQRGHIMAALYSSGMSDIYGKEDFIAFHMSGGTSEVLLCRGEKIELIGGSADLTAGQLIDRTGVALGLSFPCGAELEKLALSGIAPKNIKISVCGLECHFSGGEKKVNDMIKAGSDKESVAAFAIEFVKLTLEKITDNVIEKYGKLPLIYSGGVMSCSEINKYFTEKYGAHFASPRFSSDNAAGTALLCEREYLREGQM